MLDDAAAAMPMMIVVRVVPEVLRADIWVVVVSAVIGVPVMAPVDVLSVRPAGNGLAVYSSGEALAAMLAENAVPTVPVMVDVSENTGAPVTAASTITSAAVVALAERRVAVTTKDVTAAVVAVPERSPVVASKVRPVGTPLAVQVGELLAAKWMLPG